MTVILEFTIDQRGFELGRLLAGQEGAYIELERIVPAGDAVMPFFWVSGGDRGVLEADVTKSELIENLVLIDQVEDDLLYRVEWLNEYEDLVRAINSNEGTILDARRDGEWFFRLRFIDHQHLAEFYNFCSDNDLDIHIDRVYTLTEESLQGRVFDLTNEQREALVLAVERGYFATPRETSMSELADELSISQQAFSDRLRRGNEKLLQNVLFEE
jgi:predicted DNA binding protein